MKLDISKLLEELSTLPKTEQVDLQSSPFIVEKWWENEEQFTIPVYDIPYTNELMERYGMLHTRVMRMKKKYCYWAHTDRLDRVHIPLVTNYDNFFVIDDTIHRLPVGDVYLSKTTSYHTFVNASQEERIHLVAATLAKAEDYIEVIT